MDDDGGGLEGLRKPEEAAEDGGGLQRLDGNGGGRRSGKTGGFGCSEEDERDLLKLGDYGGGRRILRRLGDDNRGQRRPRETGDWRMEEACGH